MNLNLAVIKKTMCRDNVLVDQRHWQNSMRVSFLNLKNQKKSFYIFFALHVLHFLHYFLRFYIKLIHLKVIAKKKNSLATCRNLANQLYIGSQSLFDKRQGLLQVLDFVFYWYKYLFWVLFIKTRHSC